MKKLIKVIAIILIISLLATACSSLFKKNSTEKSGKGENAQSSSPDQTDGADQETTKSSSEDTETSNDVADTTVDQTDKTDETKTAAESETSGQTEISEETESPNVEPVSRFADQDIIEIWSYLDQSNWHEFLSESIPDLFTLLHSLSENLVYSAFYHDPATDVTVPELDSFPFLELGDGSLVLEKDKLTSSQIADFMHLIVSYRMYPIEEYGESDEPMYVFVSLSDVRYATMDAFFLTEDQTDQVEEEFYNKMIIFKTTDPNLVEAGGVGGIFGTQFYPFTVYENEDGILRVSGCITNFEYSMYCYTFEAFFEPNSQSLWDGYSLVTLRLFNVDENWVWQSNQDVLDSLEY